MTVQEEPAANGEKKPRAQRKALGRAPGPVAFPRTVHDYDDDDDRRGSRGGHGGWSGDPEGHSEAARRGWESRR